MTRSDMGEMDWMDWARAESDLKSAVQFWDV